MNQKRLLWLSVGLAVLPALLTAVLYAGLPDQVPLQWGFGGEVSYGPKSQLWVLSLMPLMMLFLFRALPKIDPRRQNYARFQRYYDGFCLVMLFFLLGMNTLVLLESLWTGRIAVWRVVTVGIGAIFLFLGNLLPKVKNNFFMGVRTPWTLSDPDVWNRSNRLGGQCFFLMGLVALLAGLLLPELAAFAVLMAGTAIVVLIPTLASYIWYQRSQKDRVDKGNGR